MLRDIAQRRSREPPRRELDFSNIEDIIAGCTLAGRPGPRAFFDNFLAISNPKIEASARACGRLGNAKMPDSHGQKQPN